MASLDGISFRWHRTTYVEVNGFVAPQGSPDVYEPYRATLSTRRPHHDFASLMGPMLKIDRERLLSFVSEWGPLGLLHHQDPQISYVPDGRGWMTDLPLPAVPGEGQSERFHRLSPPTGRIPVAKSPEELADPAPLPGAAFAPRITPAQARAFRALPARFGRVTDRGGRELGDVRWLARTYFPSLDQTPGEIAVPRPDTPDFWTHYSEPIDEVEKAALLFCSAFQVADSTDNPFVTDEWFTSTLNGTEAAIETVDGQKRLTWRPRSLLDAMYLALAIDVNNAPGLLRFCARANCGRAFTASRPSAIHCSETCKRAAQQQKRRQRRKAAE